MMAEYLFYTTEGYTHAPDGCEIDNCQILGQAQGNTPAEALRCLLNENPWIEEHHYDPAAIVACRIVEE